MSQKQTLQRRALPNSRGANRQSVAVQHDIDTERRLITVHFGKKLTVRDIERYATMLRTNPKFQATFSEIADLTQVEEVDLQADEFLRLADKIDPFFNGSQAGVRRPNLNSESRSAHAQDFADPAEYRNLPHLQRRGTLDRELRIKPPPRLRLLLGLRPLVGLL